MLQPGDCHGTDRAVFVANRDRATISVCVLCSIELFLGARDSCHRLGKALDAGTRGRPLHDSLYVVVLVQFGRFDILDRSRKLLGHRGEGL